MDKIAVSLIGVLNSVHDHNCTGIFIYVVFFSDFKMWTVEKKVSLSFFPDFSFFLLAPLYQNPVQFGVCILNKIRAI